MIPRSLDSSPSPVAFSPIRVIARPAFVSRKGNQYTSLLYQSLREQDVAVLEYTRRNLFTGNYHVFHVHWPDAVLLEPRPLHAFAGLLNFMGQASFVWLLRRPIVWTVHNLRPHERYHPTMERIFYWWWHRIVGKRVFLSRTSRQQFREFVQDETLWGGTVIYHGHYKPILKGTWKRTAARESFDIPPTRLVFGFFGLIRPYKNVQPLVRHFREAAIPDSHLLVAGMAGDDALRRQIIATAGDAKNVTLVLKHLEADEVERAACAADIVVLPYAQVLNSGTAVYALSCGRRVLAPAEPLFQELAAVVGREWFWLYQGELSADVLRRVAESWAEPAVPPDLRQLEWPESARRHKLVYSHLLEREHIWRCV